VPAARALRCAAFAAVWRGCSVAVVRKVRMHARTRMLAAQLRAWW
jgi:hypothetical protein